MSRVGLAFKCLFRILANKPLPPEALDYGAGKTPRLSQGSNQREKGLATQLLAVLQKEGRLVDFLREDISAYADAQIGSAVRDIHSGCARALAEHLELKPILEGVEDASVTVPVGFDPSRIRLLGNVAGSPPFTGILRHRGWCVTSVKLPTSEAQSAVDPVIAPAEVEIR